jgi:hypothetical protein
MERGMQDYDEWPHIEEIDGRQTDMIIESLLSAVLREDYSHKNFDGHYTSVVRHYINEECPDLLVSRAAKDRLNLGPIHYLTMLRLDYQVITKDGPHWPEGGFASAPDAYVALSIFYPNGEDASNWWPGRDLNQAALGAILQYAREIADDHYNQPDLFDGSGGYVN